MLLKGTARVKKYNLKISGTMIIVLGRNYYDCIAFCFIFNKKIKKYYDINYSIYYLRFWNFLLFYLKNKYLLVSTRNLFNYCIILFHLFTSNETIAWQYWGGHVMVRWRRLAWLLNKRQSRYGSRVGLGAPAGWTLRI